ncbi:unnamed protein product [Paramecium pentaurelia]|uniref:PSI domain-containing protein n=1 Tax=Paramecium pentaurelia TaxID=43138 RepID=A0A8S1Y4B2_9CILI|nr:unnamed protein product [Paramecium pentaurelia]
MNNKIFLIAFLLIFTEGQKISIATSCVCTQMLIESDCGKITGCQWDKTKQKCTKTETPTIDTTNFATYCDQFNTADECPKKNPCAWDGKACTHFTGCTPFVYNDDSKCSAVSTRCITDGVRCVEKAACSTYLFSKSCVINNLGRYCYWNTSDAKNPKCEDADDCHKLPITLISDQLCRAQLYKCTAKEGGGCVESGAKCDDQVSEIGCVQDQSGGACFWNEGKCLDKTCDNAPKDLITDQACKDFISTCTTKQGGGCVTRSNCGAAIQAACMKNSLGEDCFWNGTECVDKTCGNALAIYKTNSKCQAYLKKCITTGNGCTDNTGCSAAKIQEACDTTLTGTPCHWDGVACKNKTCDNAGILYVGHEQCTTFMASCTAKSGSASGCQDRSCSNAPKTNTTNEQCEAYLPKQNCVTQVGGGCRTNTTCEAINLEEVCKTDVKGNICFWNGGKCQTKICTNAPTSNNNHSLCNSFLSTCTVGSGQTCVDKTCENVQEETNCDIDYLNKPCIYKSRCYQKQCALASKMYTTYQQCRNYLQTCTLDNSGSGCMDLPIKCEAIRQAEGCQMKYGGGKCGWIGNNCVDQTCQTAPSANYSTSSGCNTYKTGCVVDNDQAGCIDLPATCSARKLQDNCEIEQARSISPFKCQWDNKTDSTNPVCIDIKCENAHLVTLQGNVSQVGCWSYEGLKCVINTNNDKCIPRPKICNGLAETACKQLNVIQVSETSTKNCYWDIKSATCLDKVCANITLDAYTQANCQTANTKCTVNGAQNKCQDLVACNEYQIADQCKFDQNENICVWDGTCKDKPCTNTEDSLNYDSDEKCQTYSKKCTLTQMKCSLKLSTCENIKNQAACEQHTISKKQQCQWNSSTQACANADSFDCTKITGTGLLLTYCYFMSNTCSVNSAGTACIAQLQNCGDYLSNDVCSWAPNQGNCYWNGGACVMIVDSTKCTDIFGTSAVVCKSKKSLCTWTSGNKCVTNCEGFEGPFNYDACQAFSAQCTIKRDGTGCVMTAPTCAETAQANCTHADEGICYLNGNTCTYASGMSVVGQDNCGSITGKGLTTAYCKGISFGNVCSSNSEQTACVRMKNNCSEYSSPWIDCVSTTQLTQQKCVINAAGTGCEPYVSNCATVKVFKEGAIEIKYTDAICYFYQCQAKSDGSGCETKSPTTSSSNCIDHPGPFTYEACIGFNKMCSVNANKTACIFGLDTCSEYDFLEDCGHSFTEGECQLSGNKCVQKTCDLAPVTATNLAGCQSYSTNCVVRVGGCQFRDTCASYTIRNACVKDAHGNECLWNPSKAKCVDKSCSAAESSTSFDSHVECLTAGKCTVKATVEKTVGQGCIAFAACSSYTIQEQCKKNTKEEDCVWNTNPNPAICADKSCATAPNTSYNDHDGCQGYLLGCTVDVVDVNGTPTLQGCIAYKTCSLYTHKEQCKISSDKDGTGANIECGWNGSTCVNKNCLTAQETVNTPTLCNDYLPGCTVNATDNGCVEIPDYCEGMTKNQCYEGSVDKSSRKCYWDITDDEGKCITKRCENSPKYGSESECENYLSGCTISTNKCMTKICEDFTLTTDALCKAALSTCTSNGFNCVLRGACNQALTEAGCVTDSKNQPCQWMAPKGQTAYCTNKTCATAPTTLTTEAQCVSYFTPSLGTCTTKKDGGCTIKGSCTTANFEACKTDNFGNDCQWDTETNGCRLKECKDFAGTTHSNCNKIKAGCTAGLNGRCAQMTNCQDTKVRAACIEGNDGPCLWVAKYMNADFTFGACFSYESCKSLDWTLDSSCKLISPNCTTDGTECVGITSCADTNTNGGCKTGTDGECIQTISAKESTDTICKKFTSCADAYYLTHSECNLANSKCTSDYSKGCIPLAACSTYTQNQCNLNKDGAQRDANGLITSTGICVWDDTAKQCKDQQCTDLTYTTEQECSSKLKTCTSDGVKCLVKVACKSYTTQAACNVAGGTEGACFWVATDTSGSCRTKVCSDIPNGTTLQACQGLVNCVSNGTDCIPKANCSSYITNIACNSKGSDGICVWTETITGQTKTGKCSLMTSCASAGTDANACTQASDRCQIDTKKKVCADHTCVSYSAQVFSCRYFYTWDYKNYNICSLINGVCTATSVDALKEGDCSTLTAYQYSWNPAVSKCTQCGTVVVEVNNSKNNSSSGNQVNTDSGYILGFTSIIVGLLIFN